MANLAEIFQNLSNFGFQKTIQILQYTFLRDRLNRNYRRLKGKGTENFRLEPGNYSTAETRFSGVDIIYENAKLQIKFLTTDMVRITWTPGVEPVPYAISKQDCDNVDVAFEQMENSWRVVSSQLTISGDFFGGLEFFDSQNSLIHQQFAPQFSRQTENPSWRASCQLYPEERIYGLGEQTQGLNRRGASYRLWNSDPMGAYGPGDDPIYMPLPVFIGLHHRGSYLEFFENYHAGVLRFSSSSKIQTNNLASFQFNGGALRYYFILGVPALLLERFTELTGRPELPPMWSLGYHQSRWGYRSAQEIRDVLDGFLSHDLPISAIHLDIDYMDEYRVFTVDKTRFPDLADLARDLNSRNVKLVTIIDPGVKVDPDYEIYREGLEQNHFLKNSNGEILKGVVWPGWTAFPDFSNPPTRSWWSTKYQTLLESGVSGIWHDMNEPTSFALGDKGLPLETQHAMEDQPSDHEAGHNLYGLLMNRAGYEGLKKIAPDRRPWIISRSGWVSQQRYAWNWTGDTRTGWDSLALTIPLIIGSGLSGQPYNGPDIGGFSADPSAELYLRWFQLATFLPFFRTHSAMWASPREPWKFGEPYTSVIRKFLRLRYQLLPYLYTLAWEANQKGYPLIRPLFWYHPSNAELWEIQDEFFLGDSILVAPVLDEGSHIRRCYLPPGQWYNFWNSQTYNGPGEIIYACGLEEIPVFIQSGSIIPMLDHGKRLWSIYPPETGKDHSHEFFSDAGDGYGEIRLDLLHLSNDGKKMEIHWDVEGFYPSPDPLSKFHLHGLDAEIALVDGLPIPIENHQFVSTQFKTARFEVKK